jgi:hypothetical protein
MVSAIFHILPLQRKCDFRYTPQRGYGGHTLRSEIVAPLITREVLLETYFLVVFMAANARQDHFCSFKHHAHVEPCKILISLAASSISGF